MKEQETQPTQEIEPMVKGVRDSLTTMVDMAELIGRLARDNAPKGRIEIGPNQHLMISHYDDGELNGFFVYIDAPNGQRYRLSAENETRAGR